MIPLQSKRERKLLVLISQGGNSWPELTNCLPCSRDLWNWELGELGKDSRQLPVTPKPWWGFSFPHDTLHPTGVLVGPRGSLCLRARLAFLFPDPRLFSFWLYSLLVDSIPGDFLRNEGQQRYFFFKKSLSN